MKIKKQLAKKNKKKVEQKENIEKLQEFLSYDENPKINGNQRTELKKEFSFDDLSSLIKKPKNSNRMSMIKMDDNLFKDKPPVILENNEEFKFDEIEQLKLNNRIKKYI